MTLKEHDFIQLFSSFINDSYKGRRLKPDGKTIRPQTVDNYAFVLQHLSSFSKETGFALRIKVINTIDKKILTAERSYWKKFYQQFTTYLYKQKGCYDNYVGNVIKVIKVFFNYLNKEKHIRTGDFYKRFYVCKEEVPIITLMPQQLNFLIQDKAFYESLPKTLQSTNDIFIFGCTVALRSSDLFALRFSDIEKLGDSYYLAIRTIKTETAVRMKLPGYAIAIIEKQRKDSKRRKTIFAPISKNQFNKNVKSLIKLAGWTEETGKTRSVRGKQVKQINAASGKQYLFYDLVSSHTMRRTAITTMLMLGMKEHVVRKISGHSANSKAFYRYVNLVQSYLDNQLDEVFDKLGSLKVA